MRKNLFTFGLRRIVQRPVVCVTASRAISLRALVFGPRPTEKPRDTSASAPATVVSSESPAIVKPRIAVRNLYPAQSYLLVLGGNGTIGKTLVNVCRRAGWVVVSVDHNENREADRSVVMDTKKNWQENTQFIQREVDKYLTEVSKGKAYAQKFDAIVNAGGGWDGGACLNSPFESADRHHEHTMRASFAASVIARSALCEGGVLLLTGAAPTVQPLYASVGWRASLEGYADIIKSLPNEADYRAKSLRVGGVVPFPVDTPANRATIKDPSSIDTTWVDPMVLSEHVYDFIEGREVLRTGTIFEYRFPDGVPRLVPVRS